MTGAPALRARHGGARAAVPRGFTMIEMAVVLFVIALLLSATLVGIALIDAARVDRLIKDFRGIPIMIHTYQDRFRALPGDDNRAATRFDRTDLVDGDGNGRIDGAWNDTGGVSETSRLWQHLRAARLTTGAMDLTAADAPPVNALDKPIGLQSGTADPALTPVRDSAGRAMPGQFIICSRGIPGKLALTLDIKLDDGNPAAGWLRATEDTGNAYALGAAPATLAGVAAGGFYIVCLGI